MCVCVCVLARMFDSVQSCTFRSIDDCEWTSSCNAQHQAAALTYSNTYIHSSRASIHFSAKKQKNTKHSNEILYAFTPNIIALYRKFPASVRNTELSSSMCQERYSAYERAMSVCMYELAGTMSELNNAW